MDSKWIAKQDDKSVKNLTNDPTVKKDKPYLLIIKTIRNILNLKNDTDKEVKSNIVSNHSPITQRKIQYQI